MRERVDLAVVGGGASGLAAAISAARCGASTVVLERLPSAGKKLLATGGGRCNLLNDRLAASAFTSTDPGVVASVLDRFGASDIRGFFAGLGLLLHSDDAGRVYPATNQAASVLKVLELEMDRLGILTETRFEVDRINPVSGGFSIRAADGRGVEAGAVVLAGGGRSYPALGSNGSCHGLAASFGHTLIKPVPSAVPLVVTSRMCHPLQGQRLRVRTESRVGLKTAQRADGELLFTRYGLSGTAILDISESVSIALNREGRRDVRIVVDLVPSLNSEDLVRELARRLGAGWATRELTSGLLPEKFSLVLPDLLREAGGRSGRGGALMTALALTSSLKSGEYAVEGTRGWNEAEFTAGGVDVREVKPGTLESRLRRGLYFAGEVLDVQGGRGGFNLAWAWASGLVAGQAQ